MDEALNASNEAPPRWRLGLALAGAAAVLLVALLPAPLAPVVTEAREREEIPEDVWATDVHVDPVPVRPGEAPRPVKNQKRAPCTAGLEVEVSGACWLPIERRPCPPQTVAWQDQCLLPVAVPRAPVTSLDGDGGSVPR
jgi:serine/threonine-protein kinase